MFRAFLACFFFYSRKMRGKCDLLLSLLFLLPGSLAPPPTLPMASQFLHELLYFSSWENKSELRINDSAFPNMMRMRPVSGRRPMHILVVGDCTVIVWTVTLSHRFVTTWRRLQSRTLISHLRMWILKHVRCSTAKHSP